MDAVTQVTPATLARAAGSTGARTNLILISCFTILGLIASYRFTTYIESLMAPLWLLLSAAAFAITFGCSLRLFRALRYTLDAIAGVALVLQLGMLLLAHLRLDHY